jgi:diguanylate cyclase (GGDEF)-like protein
MSRTPVTADAKTPFRDVCKMMAERRISCVVILEEGKPQGLVTERDVVRHVAADHPGGISTGQALVRKVLAVSPQTSIHDALDKMRSNKVRRLIVTSRGKLSGVVTQTNLLEASQRLIDRYASRHVQLSAEATQDGLTGLFNRRSFFRLFAAEISRAQRYGSELALAMFDLDKFKRLNDQYGHQAGDKVLELFGWILKKNCREVDIPARYGGEEFAVLMPAVGAASASVFADRVRQELANSDLSIGDGRRRVTVSAGISEFSKLNNSAEAMIGQADESLYAAKKAGRNRVFSS